MFCGTFYSNNIFSNKIRRLEHEIPSSTLSSFCFQCFCTELERFAIIKNNKDLPSNDFYKLYENKDTLHVNEKYRAYIEIDPTKINDLSKITVFFDKTYEVPRYGNKYDISFNEIGEGLQSYDITIINREKKPAEIIKFTRTLFLKLPVYPNPPEIDYIVVPEKYPEFNSKIYKNFNDYLIQAFKKENIKASGRVYIDYYVMKDGSTQFKQAKGYGFEEEDKIRKIITDFHDWIPGEDNGKKVNVYVSAFCDFK
ncbi:MAG: hypothetical protein ACXVPU_13320 [Bacteroidia bacterium]